MKEKIRKILKICLILIFVFSTGAFLYLFMETRAGMEIYEDAEELAIDNADNVDDEEDEEGEEDRNTINIEALKAFNEDVIGWIRIPGTQIDYPLVQGEDNQFYLKHAWNKEKNVVGAVFLESTNAEDFSDFNTLIYAHYMRNGSMFGSLKEYRDQNFWKEHPYVYICDESGWRQYEIFASYEANISAETYRINYTNNTKMQEFINMCLGKSVIETGIVPTKEDKILTLSTCTGNGTYRTRWVVQARLMGEDNSTGETNAAFEMKNENFVIDYSNTSDGYATVKCLNEGESKIKIQVVGPANTYTYDFAGADTRTFPLSDGNGNYTVRVCENVTDNKYTVSISADFPVELKDELAPFIRSNEYVDYASSEKILSQAEKITGKADETLEKAEAIFNYTVKNISGEPADSTSIEQLPVLDEILETKKGNCFDYASLMTGMLRSLNIPAKLVIGNDGSAYHAWISVWTEEAGWNSGLIYFDGTTWEYKNPDESVLSDENDEEEEADYMDIEENYLDKYLY